MAKSAPPVPHGDGVALRSMAHPYSFGRSYVTWEWYEEYRVALRRAKIQRGLQHLRSWLWT